MAAPILIGSFARPITDATLGEASFEGRSS
jgi:hypothetical protein